MHDSLGKTLLLPSWFTEVEYSASLLGIFFLGLTRKESSTFAWGIL